MSSIVQSDEIYLDPQGEKPNYDVNNPVWRLTDNVTKVDLAAGREFYRGDSLDYLFPYNHLVLYNVMGQEGGPEVAWEDQTNKSDFQKQNIKDFVLAHFYLVRGYVDTGTDQFPFVKVSYDAGMKTPLSQNTNHDIGPAIQMWCKIRDTESNGYITLPYNPNNDRYEVELWGYTGQDLNSQLGEKGRQALQDGLIQVRNDMVYGHPDEFSRDAVAETALMYNINPGHTMHPIFPLHVELAFSNEDATVWDSQFGENYHVEFNMILRGWGSYVQGGVSPNPHGGVGYLEFRNLFSHYFNHPQTIGYELQRDLEPWNIDANGNTGREDAENFMAVNYMDLHILTPKCAIGIHRHKDNQEIFMLLRGSALMITGDWLQFPNRHRAFEVRTMRYGDMTLCKNGMLHSLINLTDEDIELLMFGGYD